MSDVTPSPARQAAGRLAAARRHHPNSDHTPLVQDLSTARICEYIAKVQAGRPHLRADNIATINAALRGELV